ncbi:uncharacterized protein PAC_18524 [Phialocephala subalpina]|uniref:Knr4/Smi1-like domain-containing protein n=1 Tax=Phialocephala subalpina TaxID=576137 RepID=A0A1L7XUD5_9HELO|nr:uncharacterized protein PAC_18524 [Phialocephala subalpina]
MAESSTSIPPTGPLSRDEIVAIVTNFYTFLTTYPFLLPEHIKTPPASGWPSSTVDIWRKMGKSEAVLDLLAHLPYIDASYWDWFSDTKPINYIGRLPLRRLNEFRWEDKRSHFEPFSMKLSKDVFSLTEGYNYGKWLLVDLKAGTITDYSMLGGPSPDGEEEAGDEGWRLYPTVPIKQFFDACIDKMSGASIGKNRNYVRV